MNQRLLSPGHFLGEGKRLGDSGEPLSRTLFWKREKGGVIAESLFPGHFFGRGKKAG
jgi:hypothetical protein